MLIKSVYEEVTTDLYWVYESLTHIDEIKKVFHLMINLIQGDLKKSQAQVNNAQRWEVSTVCRHVWD